MNTTTHSGSVMERRWRIYTQMLLHNDRGGPWRLCVCVRLSYFVVYVLESTITDC